jgi:hypothetical protein
MTEPRFSICMWVLVISMLLIGSSQDLHCQTPSNFNPITPCRVVDTRNATGTFGGPILAANASRSFPIPTGACSIPATATAYAFNVTVIPPAALGYLTAYPTGATVPLASVLNDLQGQIVANAAVVAAGTSGAISVFVPNSTHLVLDIYGYYSPVVASSFSTGYGLLTVTSNTNNCVGTPSTPCIQVNSAIFPRLQEILSPAPGSGSAGTNAFTGVGTPPWTSYTQYPAFIFVPDVNCSGNNDTLNVSNLGALPLQILTNGVAGPTVAGSCTAGMPVVAIPTPSSAASAIGGASGIVLHQ